MGSVKLESTEHNSGTWLEYPTIADVDGDGHAEIVVANEAQNGTRTGIYVFGDANSTWRPGRRTWNQHAYHITNVNDDGTIPAHAALNWASYNNFRSGDMTAGDGLAAADLVVAEGELCELECDDGRLFVWVHVGNEGAVDLAASSLPVFDVYTVVGGVETFLESVDVGTGLGVGWYQDSVRVVVDGVDFAKVDALRFVVHSDELECDSDNNALEWKGPFCE